MLEKQNPITFKKFVDFLETFAQLGDDAVSKRFTFGELCLSRLNMLARLFLGK